MWRWSTSAQSSDGRSAFGHILICRTSTIGAVVLTLPLALLALPKVENLCGRLDLDELLALIGACDGLVACSTGPMHLSAALGRPTLACSHRSSRWIRAAGGAGRGGSAVRDCLRCGPAIRLVTKLARLCISIVMSR
jgi:ADP-heptose:LPS heptosyltransferase